MGALSASKLDHLNVGAISHSGKYHAMMCFLPRPEALRGRLYLTSELSSVTFQPSDRGKPLSFQNMILRLHTFWSEQGCAILQPYDTELGAGTLSPHTTLRALGPRPWKAAYVQPCRRPSDGRYGENPNRLQHYYQYQVLLKPTPENSQDLLLESYRAIGIDPHLHDIRFVEDDWETRRSALGDWDGKSGAMGWR